jgi:quercetin dioxygenase-like cupin family protein
MHASFWALTDPYLEETRRAPKTHRAGSGDRARRRIRSTIGDRMNDRRKWQVAHIDDVERRGRDVFVREHLGIRAFGVNAYTPGEDGALIGEHTEAGSGQEELYIVLDGQATFEIDGETIDAPAGTFVFVGPESRRKATGDGTILAVGATPGEAYEGIDWGQAWPLHSESMTAYSEKRYADALVAVRSALEHMPDHAGLHYNYACFATLAGDTGDDTFAHLRRSVELLPRFREDARRDDDFAGIRKDPRFERALR